MAKAISGRGATRNINSGRLNLPEHQDDGDWLDAREEIDGAPPPLRTTITVERARRILTRNASPDVGFEQSINVYRGCEHGCIYCFARPTHAYHDLSPGLDFESRLFVKPEAATLLEREIAHIGYIVKPVAMGTNTDPYQPIEGRYRLTRACLEVFRRTRHPVTITTKSNRVLLDLDLLADLARDQLVSVMISVTSLSPATARTLEPRAPHPERRLAAVKQLAEAGVPVYVSIAPVIPQITDHELEHLVERAAEAGAWGVNFIPVRLPHEVAPLFRAWLDTYYPDRAAKVMATIQSLRGGRDNDPRFGSRMRGEGPWADLLRTRMQIAKRKYGLGTRRLVLRTDLFERPVLPGQQLSLL